MIFVPGGTFQMGSNEYDDEKPIHSVTLSDYYIGETQVTQGLWRAVMGDNPSNFKKGDDYPVECVSWNDIVNKFLPELNRQTGKNFCLPTEAQWEFAARGGNDSKGYKYSGSNNIKDVAVYDEVSYDLGDKNPNYGTHPVKSKSPNELGIYGMSGNVWEWCQDLYKEDHYK
ncbi:MAG: SUMF1/EgtB/PvdO family nonheme iron enzyme, partial [Bacteroidales bacterium]|nr:SUMF1/EgtB/PvdO family nonheme iron enzyme [Bacteroidales bacterium]